MCGFSSIILLQTRQKSAETKRVSACLGDVRPAGVLYVRQGFLTQSAAKFAEKTCAYACEDRFLMAKDISGTFIAPYSANESPPDTENKESAV